ncbi:hypothetical protein ACFYU5_34670 [Nocardia aobensis]|uniref:Uncharacterized protein n=1 Tax=Nocardia aobensis TaxID=257277 RepID=A0ABW6PEK2_9NOCA|nr:hypothetical protein [Nocardia elegans]MBF6451090.1 hypothetical protein [Nocardia elegans]
MKANQGKEVTLVIGVDVGGFRREKYSDRELFVIEAADLRQAQRMSYAIDREHSDSRCCKLLSIDARTSTSTGPVESIRASIRVRSLASLVHDIVAVGIADGAVVSVDADTDLLALWQTVAEDLTIHGNSVVDHVYGWTPDGWQYSCSLHDDDAAAEATDWKIDPVAVNRPDRSTSVELPLKSELISATRSS